MITCNIAYRYCYFVILMFEIVVHMHRFSRGQNIGFHLLVKVFCDQITITDKRRIFAASIITWYWLDDTIVIIFFSDNATLIYWLKETNSCFSRIASKAPVRIQQNLYTVFEWIWQSNLQNSIFSWRVLCEKVNIKVSSV